MAKNTEQIGIGHAHYAGPEFGPFRCDNCIHFVKPTLCGHPEVVAIKEIPHMNGKAVVHPRGCCNEFRSEE